MTKLSLDEIIKKLEDEEAVAKVTDKHEEARSSYEMGKRKATTYKGLMDEVTKYIKHHHKVVAKTELPDHRAKVEAHNFLVSFGRRLLGKEDAPEYEAISTVIKEVAKKGKIADILDTYKTAQRDRDEAEYGEAIVRDSLDPLDFEHSAKIAGEYLEKHGNLLREEERKELKRLKPEALAYRAAELISKHRAARREYKAVAEQQPTEGEK